MSIRAQRLNGTTFGNLNIVENDKFIITTTGAATATLPAGYTGQQVYILIAAAAGSLTLTADFETGTTATFDAAKDSLTLLYTPEFGWMTISNQGTVVFA